MRLPYEAGSQEGGVTALAWAQGEAGDGPGVEWSRGRRKEGEGVGLCRAGRGLEGCLGIWKESVVAHQRTDKLPERTREQRIPCVPDVSCRGL